MKTRRAWQKTETEISENKQPERERKLEMGGNQRVTETDQTNDWEQDSAQSLPAPSLLSIHQLPASTGNAYAVISSFTRTNQ